MRSLALVAFVLPLLACTPSETPEKRSPKKKSVSEPSPRPTPPTPPTPTPTSSEPEPVTPAPTGEWWCVCYQSEAQTGPQPTTACRPIESECRELEKRIAEGGRGIVAGSLSHDCRVIRGEHPGDVVGGRERWLPSKRPGSWTSENACLLEGAATEPDAFAILDQESIGPLRLGMSSIEVVETLGEPSEKGTTEQEEATGDFVQSWDYPATGVHLFMRSATRRGGQTLGSVSIEAPSKLQTKQAITIGSSRAEVEKAYGAVEDRENTDPDDKTSFVAGSIYGGVIFGFEGDVVQSIFMGAAAE